MLATFAASTATTAGPPVTMDWYSIDPSAGVMTAPVGLDGTLHLFFTIGQLDAWSMTANTPGGLLEFDGGFRVAPHGSTLWIGGAGGGGITPFLDPVNWSEGNPPGPNDVVTIGGYTDTLSLTEDLSLTGLIVNAGGVFGGVTTDLLFVNAPGEGRILSLTGGEWAGSGPYPQPPSLLVGDGAGDITLVITPSNLTDTQTGIDAHTVVVGAGDSILDVATLRLDEAFAWLHASDSMRIGVSSDGNLHLSNGALVESEGETIIGDESGSRGTVTIANGAEWHATAHERFVIGRFGDGQLLIQSGGRLLTDLPPDPSPKSVVLAQEVGSEATVVISGAGSAWIEANPDTQLEIGGGGSAEIFVIEGGLLHFPEVRVRKSGLLGGTGVIGQSPVDVRNNGELRIGNAGGVGAGVAAPATLTINGDYRQFADTNDVPSGRIRVRMFEEAGVLVSDVLMVSGLAEVAGGIIVEAAESLDNAQGIDTTVPIVQTAGSITLNPKLVVQTPVLGGTRYLRLQNANGAAAGGGSAVSLQVASIAELIGLDPDQEASLNGNPNAAVVAQLDDINGDDIAVIVPGEMGSSGSLFVVLSDVVTEGGAWAALSVTETLLGLGEDLVSIAAGDLDGDGRADLAIGHAGTEDDVRILLNTPGDPGSFPGVDAIIDENDGVIFDDPLSLAIDRFGDDDGVADIAIVDNGNNRVVVVELSGPEAVDGVIQMAAPVDPIVDDPLRTTGNKDGLRGLAILGTGGSGPAQVVVYSQQVGGGFLPDAEFGDADAVVEVGASASGLAIGDLNVDDRDDIVVIDNVAGTVTVTLVVDPNGPYALTPPVALDAVVEPSSVVLVDFDADGDRDIAVVARETDLSPDRVVQVLRNNFLVEPEGGGEPAPSGAVLFETPVTQAIGTDPIQVLRGDFDGNGIEDLAAISGVSGGGASPDGPPSGVLTVGLNATPPKPPPPCPADLDSSGDVGFADLVTVLSTWGPCPGCPADLDGSGDVGFSDLVTLLAAWGPCPG